MRRYNIPTLVQIMACHLLSHPMLPYCLMPWGTYFSENLFKKVFIPGHALHYDDVIMTMLASQITSLTVVYSIVYSGVNQRKHQSSASLAFVRAIHRGPVNFPHKWPVTRKMFPFDDVIMETVVRELMAICLGLNMLQPVAPFTNMV